MEFLLDPNIAYFVLMVAIVFVCFDLLYPKAKGSSTAPSGRIDEPSEAGTQALDGHRRVAA